MLGQQCGPSLGGPDDVAGPHDAALLCPNRSLAQGCHPGVLVDSGAPAFDSIGKSQGEAERMDPGTVRVESGTAQSLDGDSISGGRGLQPGRSRAPVVGFLGLGPGSGRLGSIGGNDQRPALVEPAVDAFCGSDSAHLVDTFAQGGVLIPGRELPVLTSQHPRPHGIQG